VHDLSHSINGVDFQPYTATLDLDPSETPFVYAFATDNAGNRSPLITYALNAPPITITGEVKDEAGIAIAGVALSLSGAQSATTQTDATGNYAFPAVASGGNYVLSATKGSLLFRPQDQEIDNPDANLILNFNSFTADAAGAINATWNAGPGNWATAANWNPSINFPNNGNGGFTYTATFNLGFNDAQAITDAVGVTIDQHITIRRFALLGGIVTGAFNLTLLDILAWSGYGGLLGTGTTSVAGANSTISGIPNKFLSRTLNNSGTITFTGSGQGTGTVLFGVGSPSRPGVINNRAPSTPPQTPASRPSTSALGTQSTTREYGTSRRQVQSARSRASHSTTPAQLV
jgi:hypothetical protein